MFRVLALASLEKKKFIPFTHQQYLFRGCWQRFTLFTARGGKRPASILEQVFFSLFLLIFKMAIDSTHLLVLLLMSWSSNLTTQRLQHRYLSHLKELEIENINFLIFQRLRFGLVRFTQQFIAIQSVIYSLILMNVGKFCLELCKFLFHSINVVSSSVE